MAIEFKRMILKVSDQTGEVATVPGTNDHTDGSWLVTDIYVGELFLNVVDDILQTRTTSGIINLISGGSGVTTFSGLTDTPAVYTGAGKYFVKVKEDLSGLEFVEKEDDTLIATITVSTRDFIITDKDKNLQNDGDTSLTMRDNATVSFPVGTQIYLTRATAGEFDIIAGEGVTINSVGGALKLREQWSGAVLLQTAIDVWNFNGDITT